MKGDCQLKTKTFSKYKLANENLAKLPLFCTE